jgi:cytoskeletal protein CcmA (bactofilin family)
VSIFSTKGKIMAETSDVVTVVGPEAYFQGVITVRGSLRIEGEVEGDIHEAATVVVGRRGKVRGDVTAESVVVAGSLNGDITASVQIELKTGGRILGDIRSPKLVIEEGAHFEGHCTMGDAAKADAPAHRRVEKAEKTEKQALPS